MTRAILFLLRMNLLFVFQTNDVGLSRSQKCVVLDGLEEGSINGRENLCSIFPFEKRMPFFLDSSSKV
jgi:hypothetical protein